MALEEDLLKKTSEGFVQQFCFGRRSSRLPSLLRVNQIAAPKDFIRIFRY